MTDLRALRDSSHTMVMGVLNITEDSSEALRLLLRCRFRHHIRTCGWTRPRRPSTGAT